MVHLSENGIFGIAQCLSRRFPTKHGIVDFLPECLLNNAELWDRGPRPGDQFIPPRHSI
jgi:hypothetical protein